VSFPVPLGDVLLHGGDLTGCGRTREYKRTMDWLSSLPHPIRIIIAGNHDLTLDPKVFEDEDSYDFSFTEQARESVAGTAAKAAGVVYLESSSHEFQAKEGGRRWSVFGSPWTPYFGGMAFNYCAEEAESIVAAFPKTDILLTHGPPHRIHDLTTRGVFAGCPALRERVAILQPRLHVFGHIHEGRGATLRQWEKRQVDDPAQQPPNIDMTAFVNPANDPLGPKAFDEEHKRLKPGANGWLPVIVDLLD